MLTRFAAAVCVAVLVPGCSDEAPIGAYPAPAALPPHAPPEPLRPLEVADVGRVTVDWDFTSWTFAEQYDEGGTPAIRLDQGRWQVSKTINCGANVDTLTVDLRCEDGRWQCASNVGSIFFFDRTADRAFQVSINVEPEAITIGSCVEEPGPGEVILIWHCHKPE